MLNSYTVEGKTLDDALNSKLEELNLKKEDFFINIEEVKGKLFKSKKYRITFFLKSDIIDYIKKYLKEISNLSGIPMNIEVREKDDVINVMIASDNTSIMIGKQGRTINAIELMIKNTLRNLTKMNIKVIVDASNYKHNKLKRFEQNIRKIAREVQKTKIDSRLDPMNSYERRIVHTIVSEFENLSTISEGEEPNRYVIIKYKEN